ncbi:hypothetical protein ATY75_30765 [Rhizobium sp. N122]|nr:hypothetical protein ATY75_30765 [Rhizobium sp. N122]
MPREEWRRSRQGKKVSHGRCGRTIEAKPFSGQTCLIEPANGAPLTLAKGRGNGGRAQLGRGSDLGASADQSLRL